MKKFEKIDLGLKEAYEELFMNNEERIINRSPRVLEKNWINSSLKMLLKMIFAQKFYPCWNRTENADLAVMQDRRVYGQKISTLHRHGRFCGV